MHHNTSLTNRFQLTRDLLLRAALASNCLVTVDRSSLFVQFRLIQAALLTSNNMSVMAHKSYEAWQAQKKREGLRANRRREPMAPARARIPHHLADGALTKTKLVSGADDVCRVEVSENKFIIRLVSTRATR